MSAQTKWLIGIALALAGLILQQSEGLRADMRDIRAGIRATNVRIDALTETVAQVREVQAQHSVKLDQLLEVAPPVETEVLDTPVSRRKQTT